VVGRFYVAFTGFIQKIPAFETKGVKKTDTLSMLHVRHIGVFSKYRVYIF
jgi:hypothetical protein